MAAPIIIPRAKHRISRRDIDPEALKVLYRLHEGRYVSYLVGGSVRDLLLGRRPKDFDVGTDAHPYQIKKLFRNCWIIGRRFRLAHVKFGPKTIEVATFRRIVPDTVDGTAPSDTEIAPSDPVLVATSPEATSETGAEMIHRDNTFGTPEEDAFRRDFTINGLFYDIATFSVIDYVGGLADLEAAVVRSIGDPRVRFVEDPVRMLRAVVMASRLGFRMDDMVVDAIAEHRDLIAQASPARLLEEYYKILRSGSAEATFHLLGDTRLLELMTPELAKPSPELWAWLRKLDSYRRQFPSAPAAMTNTLLVGALLVPTGILERTAVPRREDGSDRISVGILPIARKDIERLRHILQLLPKLTDPALPPRVARSLIHRPAFADALVWLEVFGDTPEALEHWKQAALHQREHVGADQTSAPPGEGESDAAPGPRRRRRRRRRRRGPAPTKTE